MPILQARKLFACLFGDEVVVHRIQHLEQLTGFQEPRGHHITGPVGVERGRVVA